MCSIRGFLKENLTVSQVCTDSKTYSITVKNAEIGWHNKVWKCVKDRTESLETAVFLQVPITSVTMTYPELNSVTVKENTEQVFTCESSSGRPSAGFRWYKQEETKFSQPIGVNITTGEATNGNMTKTTSSLRFYPNRSDNKFLIFCGATNIDGQNELLSSKKPKINVTYPPLGPPEIQGIDSISIIENVPRQLLCSVIDGNPVPTLSWFCDRGNVSEMFKNTSGTIFTKAVTLMASNGPDIQCTCRSSYNNDEDSIFIEILYPPNRMTLMTGQIQLTDVVKVIKGNDLLVTCNSTGNPSPEITWKSEDNAYSSKTNLQISNVDIIDNDRKYICKAENTMSPTAGSPEKGTRNVSLTVSVLHAPEAKTLGDQSIVEGQELAVNCAFTPGNPQNTIFLWTRIIDNKTWTSQTLNLPSISRNDSTVYTCIVRNTMQPTVGDVLDGESKQSFKLNVLYKTSVSKFTLNGANGTVTVKENDTVTVFCVVDSNPESTITLQHGIRELGKTNSGKSLERILVATCTDDGQYLCIGSNAHNNGKPANKSNQLLVE